MRGILIGLHVLYVLRIYKHPTYTRDASFNDGSSACDWASHGACRIPQCSDVDLMRLNQEGRSAKLPMCAWANEPVEHDDPSTTPACPSGIWR